MSYCLSKLCNIPGIDLCNLYHCECLMSYFSWFNINMSIKSFYLVQWNSCIAYYFLLKNAFLCVFRFLCSKLLLTLVEIEQVKSPVNINFAGPVKIAHLDFSPLKKYYHFCSQSLFLPWPFVLLWLCLWFFCLIVSASTTWWGWSVTMGQLAGGTTPATASTRITTSGIILTTGMWWLSTSIKVKTIFWIQILNS